MNETWNNKWKDYLKKERLRKMLHLSKDANLFLHQLYIVSGSKKTEERIANFGTHIYKHIIEEWKVVVEYKEENYEFIKLKRPTGEHIHLHWTYDRGQIKKLQNAFLQLTEEERKQIIVIFDDFPFEEMIKK
jgi:hypothetical protein